MSSNVEALYRKIDRIIARINARLQEISRQVQEIIDKVARWSDWAAGKIADAWRAFVKLMKKAWRKVNEAIDNTIWPGDYSDAADAWSENEVISAR